MSKTKHILKGKAIGLVFLIILLVILVFKIPNYLVEQKLLALNYTQEQIIAINKHKISKIIIDNNYYSKALASNITSKDFEKDELELYLVRDTINHEDLKLYRKLLNNDYTKEEAVKLFKTIDNQAIYPLLVFDKVNIDEYIKDYQTNKFNYQNDYLKAYKNTIEIKDFNPSIPVTLKYSLGDYAPKKLVPLEQQYASLGSHLENEAYGAFIEMMQASQKDDVYMYATTAYIAYKDYGHGDIKQGHSEFQTGLTVQVVDSETESIDEFENTSAFDWLQKHAQEYGFILRFPKNKEKITGHYYSSTIYRYVGKDLALKIKDSGLSFDEYYALELKK